MFASARRTLVTGASRPLGVELVRQCLERGDRVIAAARNPAKTSVLADLRAKFGSLDLLALDPADAASVAEAIPILESITDSLDLLIAAPAEPGPHDKAADLARESSLELLSATSLLEHYRRHAVAPVLLVRTLLPMLAAAGGARVLFVNAGLVSLSGKVQGGNYAVCASAAGLNTLARSLAHDLGVHSITVAIGNPGNVVTAGGAASADSAHTAASASVHVKDAVAGLLSVMEQLGADRSGACVDWTGAERSG